MLNFIATMKCIRQLVEVSRLYGSNKDYVLGSGGNTSFKDDKFIWIKASGTSLASITEESFVVLDRARLKTLVAKKYSNYPDEREKQIKRDLLRSCVYPEQKLRPSVETLFHEIINYNFVVHTHPTLVNTLMCSINAEAQTRLLFGDEVLYVPYVNPGYLLFKKVEAYIIQYRETFDTDPHVIFLQNHGLFVAADSIDEIKQRHNQIASNIQTHVPLIDIIPLPVSDTIAHIIPAIRMMLTDKFPRTIISRHHQLVKRYYETKESFQKIATPLTPEAVLYCNAWPLYIEITFSPEDTLVEITEKTELYKRHYKCLPKIMVIKDMGVISVAENYKLAEMALDVFEDQMKISMLSESFGGPKFLTNGEIDFINRQSMDNIQLLLKKPVMEGNGMAAKTAVFIGNTDSFSVDILENMMSKNMNMVIASRDAENGNEVVALLNNKELENHSIWVNINDDKWSTCLMTETIRNFGGIDVVLMNTELTNTIIDPETMVNNFAEILKLQASHKQDYFTDIVLLQSQPVGGNGTLIDSGLLAKLALALIPHSIKINSITTNYQHVDSAAPQVPLVRNCEAKDVLKAIYYLIDQQYETGQNLHVTGGGHLM